MVKLTPFFLDPNSCLLEEIEFCTKSSTVKESLLKILRALQLDRSVLLEGNPGVGKTSIIEFIASKTNHKLLTISLSEQTDIIDLLGSDLPIENDMKSEDSKGGSSIGFKWYDGVLLEAMKNGKSFFSFIFFYFKHILITFIIKW